MNTLGTTAWFFLSNALAFISIRAASPEEFIESSNLKRSRQAATWYSSDGFQEELKSLIPADTKSPGGKIVLIDIDFDDRELITGTRISETTFSILKDKQSDYDKFQIKDDKVRKTLNPIFHDNMRILLARHFKQLNIPDVSRLEGFDFYFWIRPFPQLEKG